MTGSSLTSTDKLLLIQYAIDMYDSETTLKEKLKEILTDKEIERSIDTLIGTQRVRRIGKETLQNNLSHIELPQLPPYLKPIVEKL